METITDFFKGSLRNCRDFLGKSSDENRRAIIKKLEEGRNALSFASDFEHLAFTEAQYQVYRQAYDIACEVGLMFDWNKWAMEGLLRGADDTWSGRGNDLRRVAFDAQREAYRKILGHAEFAQKEILEESKKTA